MPGGSQGKTATAPAANGARQAVPAEEPDQLPGWAERALQEVLTPTFWLDPGPGGSGRWPARQRIRYTAHP